MGLRRVLAVFLGVHVGPSAGEEKTVECLEQFVGGDETRIGRDEQRHAARNLGHGLGIHRPARVGGVLIVDQVMVADDADDGPRHASPPDE